MARTALPSPETTSATMFSKLRSKPQSAERTMTATKPAPAPAPAPALPAHKQQRASAAAAYANKALPALPSARPAALERNPSFNDHQWDERQWMKPFAKNTTTVVATLRFPPDLHDDHDLRRMPEEYNLYGKAQEHSRDREPSFGSCPRTTPSSRHLSVSSKQPSLAPSAKSSVSSFRSTAPSVKSVAPSFRSMAPSSKSTVTLSSKGSASSLWSVERPSSSSSNATYATSWSVDSSASTVMTDLGDDAFECNSNRPDSCTLGDHDIFSTTNSRSKKMSDVPKRPISPKSTLSSRSAKSSATSTSCAGTLYSRPQTAKSSSKGSSKSTGDITFQIVAEEPDAIYLSPNTRSTRRFR